VNARELLGLCQVQIPLGSDNSAACDHNLVARAAKNFNQKLNNAFQFICWTDGPYPAGLYHAENDEVYRFKLPLLDKIISPIGAGDAVAAALFFEWLQTKDS
jgi:sugar/nucleoside kinase (ribokinase family)